MSIGVLGTFLRVEGLGFRVGLGGFSSAVSTDTREP